ncbi:MAG: TauD/TfdA family dioxygenase [Alphaproteobacteria bacterium]|nr:TauD/TfdA family dioxygenase [Alphaproteobacteria bacterium]
MLKTRKLSPTFGLEVCDVDLATVGEEEFSEIYKLWQQEPLLLFRRQSLHESEHVAFSARFGDLDILVRDDMRSSRHPEIIYVTGMKRPDGSQLGGLGTYEIYWHHDQIYRARPSNGSIFYALEMPEGDGCTSFCNTSLGYDALPEDLRQKIEGRKAIAKYGMKTESSTQRDFVTNAAKMADIHKKTPPVSHPMVLTHPLTGKKSLYLDPNKTLGIEGYDEDESRQLIKQITEYMLQDDFIYTHSWRNGDVVLWDNGRLWHRRDGFDAQQPRFAKRTTVFLNPEDFPVPEPHVA